MKNKKLTGNLTASLALVSGSVWLGAYVLRMFISYRLFDVEMNFIGKMDTQNFNGFLFALTPAVNTTFITYTIFILAFTTFLFKSKISIKENGWLFIITLIVYITLPFEAYLMTIDYKMILELNYSNPVNVDYVIGLIKNRFEKLSSFPFIIILSYSSAYFFLVFKPLTQKKI